MSRMRRLLASLLMIGVLAGYRTSACAFGQSSQDSVVLRPTVIYVADFCLDESQIENKALLSQERPGILGNRLQLLRKSPTEQEPQKMTTIMSGAIVKYLKSKGMQAEHLSAVCLDCAPQAVGMMKFAQNSAAVPNSGWLLSGWFENIEEGQPLVQAAVGFGMGANQAQASVAVVDLAHNPGEPFLVFGSESSAGKMPGGLVALNPYVIAAKFVIDRRKGMDKDFESLGTAIAKSLMQYIEQGPAVKEHK